MSEDLSDGAAAAGQDIVSERVSAAVEAVIGLGSLPLKAVVELEPDRRDNLLETLKLLGSVSAGMIEQVNRSTGASETTAELAVSLDQVASAEADGPKFSLLINNRYQVNIAGITIEIDPPKTDILRFLPKHPDPPSRVARLHSDIRSLTGINLPVTSIGKHAKGLAEQINAAAGREIVIRNVVDEGKVNEYSITSDAKVDVADIVDQLIDIQKVRYKALFTPRSMAETPTPEDLLEKKQVFITSNNEITIDDATFKLSSHDVFILNVLIESGGGKLRDLVNFGFYGNYHAFEVAVGNLHRKLQGADGRSILTSTGTSFNTVHLFDDSVILVDNRVVKYDPWEKLDQFGELARPQSFTVMTRKLVSHESPVVRPAGQASAARRSPRKRPSADRPDRPRITDALGSDVPETTDPGPVDYGFEIEIGHNTRLLAAYTNVIQVVDSLPESAKRFGITLEGAASQNSGQDQQTVRDMMLWQRLNHDLGFPLPGSLMNVSTLEEHKRVILARMNELIEPISDQLDRGLFAVMVGLPPATKDSMQTLEGIVFKRGGNTSLSYTNAYKWTSDRSRSLENIRRLLGLEEKMTVADLELFYEQHRRFIRAQGSPVEA